MKVLVDVLPNALTSRSILRVIAALKRTAPAGVQVVPNYTHDPDLHVLHVIGDYPRELIRSDRYAVMQYCYATAGSTKERWQELWKGSEVVWSYYDLPVLPGTDFMNAPLGLDGCFRLLERQRNIGIATSGYVSGRGAEAIGEAADAALACGMGVFHLGPATVVGMKPRHEATWVSAEGIDDEQLVDMYNRCVWVSGLRYVEGFEMPVIEGFACGAAPIVFDRPEMRKWYGEFATFVPEVSGPDLVDVLRDTISRRPTPYAPETRRMLLEPFQWERLTNEFWERVL